MTIHDLPALNASLNALSAAFLVLGLCFIKAGRRRAHAAMMFSALVTSTVFLVSYVTHKILIHGIHTPFHGTGAWRPVYYFILITHIILAMVIVPLALVTAARALRARLDAHRRIARVTWPLWMYVSVTGVLVYLMLYRWFPAAA